MMANKLNKIEDMVDGNIDFFRLNFINTRYDDEFTELINNIRKLEKLKIKQEREKTAKKIFEDIENLWDDGIITLTPTDFNLIKERWVNKK